MAGYIPSSNRAQCRLTSLIEANVLTTTLLLLLLLQQQQQQQHFRGI